MLRLFRVSLVFCLSLLLFSCSSSKKTTETLLKSKAQVSYYADKFNGRKTASGEIFSNKKLTAAHRELAFGTKLKVTNLVNQKSVIVVVNDRGPFIKSRVLDLSKEAFMQITDNKNKGILNVKIEIIK